MAFTNNCGTDGVLRCSRRRAWLQPTENRAYSLSFPSCRTGTPKRGFPAN